jgi:MFS family permease
MTANLFRTGSRAERIILANAFVDAFGTSLYTTTFVVLALSVRHLSAVDVGLALSSGGVAVLILTVPVGRLADRFGPSRVLIVCKALRAVLFLIFPFAVGLPALILLVTLTAGIGAGNSAADQALLGSVVKDDDRLEALGRIRSIRNLSSIAGGSLAGVALAVGGWKMYAVVLWLNGFSYLFGAIAYCWLPRVRPAPRLAGPRVWVTVVRNGRYLALTGASTIFALSVPLLQVGIPLWITQHTSAPHWVIAIVSITNALMVVVLQTRLSRSSRTFPGARAALRWSTLWFVGSSLLLAWAGWLGTWAAVALILVASVTLTFGEILESAAWWKISYDLAPPDRRSEYLTTFSLNYAVIAMVGPVCMAALIGTGIIGWIALCIAFLVAGGVGRTLVPRTEPAPDAIAATT